MKRALAIGALALLIAGCAGETTSDSSRTYVVTMRDNEFEPSSFSVDEGETVTFRFVNRGSVEHDAFIGGEEAQEEHEHAMREAEEDGHGGHSDDERAAVTVGPGDAETLDYTFSRRGTFLIGCHQPGHYEDGMRAKVKVT